MDFHWARRLFGDLKPHSTSISHLEAVRSGRMTAAEWLLDSTDQPGPNGLIALTLFLADHLKQAPEAVAPDVLVAITRRTRDASVDLRAAAITTLLVLGQSEPEILDRARAALGDRPSAPLHWRVRRYLRDLYTSLPDTHRQRRNVLEGRSRCRLALTIVAGPSALQMSRRSGSRLLTPWADRMSLSRARMAWQ